MTSGCKRRLPNRFPVGTKLVVEGRRRGEGKVQVYSRYLEFPDGTRVRLPVQPTKTPSVSRRRARAVAEPQLHA
jgi:hypothetical protein